MKIANLTTAIMVAAIFGISQPTFAAARSTEKPQATSTNVNRISKIEIHGNVELYVSDGTFNQVKIYGNQADASAFAPDRDGVLRIGSYQAQKLVVWVTVNDLHTLAAYDNAEVRSFGTLSAIELEVKLYNNASALLNMDAFKASVTLNDHANASLAGKINEVDLKCDRSSVVDTTNLVSANLVKTDTFESIASNDL